MRFFGLGKTAKQDSYLNGMGKGGTGRSSGGIVNRLSGLGGVTDKSIASFYTPRIFDSSDELQVIYNQSWAAAKFIDIPVDDQFIHGRTFESDDEDLIDKIEAFEKKFKIEEKLRDGQKAGRLYGDAIVWFVTAESPPETKIDFTKLKEGDLKNIIVVDRYRISSVKLQKDPLQDGYMEPELYYVNLPEGQAVTVHASRVVRFNGKMPLTVTGFQNYGHQWFGISQLTPIMTTIEGEDGLARGISHLSQEASIPVVKLKELNDAICSGDTQDMNLQDRLQAQSIMKSLYRTTFLDGEDDFTRVNVTFTGLPDLMDRFAKRLAAAADIPLTRFFSESPAGLSATGESDAENYATMISSEQEKTLRPAYNKVDQFMSALLGVDEIPPFEFPSLFKSDDKSQAETLNALTVALSNALMAGMIDESEAREVLRQNPMFKSLEEKDAEDLLNELAGSVNNEAG